MERLYIITRADLPPGLQIPQSGHALRQFVADYPLLDRAWFTGENNLICLSVANEVELGYLLAAAVSAEVPASSFREPDLAGSLTAIALGGSAKKMLRRLPLALAA